MLDSFHIYEANWKRGHLPQVLFFCAVFWNPATSLRDEHQWAEVLL